MAFNPKLDIYRITLNPIDKRTPIFKDLFSHKYIVEDTSIKRIYNDNELFGLYLQDLVNHIDGKEYIKNKKKQKVFSAASLQNEKNIFHSASTFIIDELVEGGKYGQDGHSASINDKQNKNEISSDQAILDTFFFLLYTPFNNDEGILFIQSYTEETVKDVIVPFLRTFLCCQGNYKDPTIERFVPKKFKDKYKEEAIVNDFTYTTKQLLGKRLVIVKVLNLTNI